MHTPRIHRRGAGAAVLAAALALGLAGGGAAFAAGPMEMIPGVPHPRLMARWADELRLSPEQRQTIRGLYEGARPEMAGLRDRLRAAGRQLADTSPDDPGYATAVQRASLEIGETTSRLVQQGSQLRSQVHAVLTAEQKTKLRSLQAERRARMDERAAGRKERQRSRAEGRAPAAG